jgi:HEPN domain-containing protein
MAPDRLSPDDPLEWLNRARSDLTLAGIEEPGVYLEDLCFHAQQAAEKAIKGLMIRRQVRFPYVHDLNRLLELVEKDGLQIPVRIQEAARLTRFALADRYPGVGGPVTEEERQDFLRIASDVVQWAQEQIGTEEER